MVHEFKENVRSVFDPVVAFLASANVHPNVLTIVGLACAIVAGVTAARGGIRESGVWLLFSGIFDMMDGAVARKSGRTSARGAFLDSTLDRYAEGFFLAGLAWYFAGRGGADWTLLAIVLVLLGSLLVSYVRARAEGVGTTCTVGLMERPERLVLMIAMCLIGGPAVSIVLWVLVVLVHATALHRLVHVYGKLADE